MSGSPHWGHDASSVRAGIMARVLGFNHLTVDAVHPSWLNAEEVMWRDHVQGFRQAEARLRISAWLRDRFSLNGCYDDDFHSQEKRVHLIDMEALQDLARWLGASLVASRLRRQLLRHQVLGLRELFGESGVRQLFSSFHSSYDTGLDVFLRADEWPPGHLYALGARALLAAAQDHGEAVTRRTRLKLQRDCTDGAEPWIAVRDIDLLHHHIMMVTMLFLPDWIGLFSDVAEELAA